MRYYEEYKAAASRSTCTALGPIRETPWYYTMFGYPRYRRYRVVFKHQPGFWDKPTESFWGGTWEYFDEPLI